jgi:uncharacterized membrane protein YgcG
MGGANRRLGVRAAWGAAVVAMAALLAGSVGSGSAFAGSLQPSVKVLLIPGFNAPRYPGTNGIPSFPNDAPGLTRYQYAELPVSSVSSSALSAYDTIVLYGLRWADLSPAAQAAVNGFSRTGKVMIWDSDSTGSQDYSTFVHPFSTLASGETGDNHGSAVTFPNVPNPLASSDPSSPLYLAPGALVASTHLIGHMQAMHADAADWAPALIAANAQIPGGGWVLGWGYGSTGDHSGMVIYSGMDADAFHDTANPNYALKELQIELAATFNRTPDSSCAPGCAAPQVPAAGSGGVGGGSGGGGSGSGGSGGGGSGGGGSGSGDPPTGTFASCSLERKAPTSWVRGQVPLWLKTSVASGINAQVVTAGGKVVAAGVPKDGHLKLVVNTKMLPSNMQSELVGVVYVNSQRACSVSTRLRVDNQPARLNLLKLRRDGNRTFVSLRANEAAHLTIFEPGHKPRRFSVPTKGTITLVLPGSLRNGRLLLVDRAGNRTIRALPS